MANRVKPYHNRNEEISWLLYQNKVSTNTLLYSTVFLTCWGQKGHISLPPLKNAWTHPVPNLTIQAYSLFPLHACQGIIITILPVTALVISLIRSVTNDMQSQYKVCIVTFQPSVTLPQGWTVVSPPGGSSHAFSIYQITCHREGFWSASLWWPRLSAGDVYFLS